MKERPVLHYWGVTRVSADAAPELGAAIVGKVYGHPTRPDGETVRTSALVRTHGRVIETSSGHFYRLGRVSRSYRAWLRENGHRYDPSEPVKIVEART